MYFGQLYSNEVGACNHKSMSSSSSSAEKKGERPSYTCMFVLADNNNKGTRPANLTSWLFRSRAREGVLGCPLGGGWAALVVG